MEPQMTFSFDQPIEKQWRTIGLLRDETGNTFRIFIIGKFKKDVEEFLKLVKKGEFNIRVNVKPLPIPAEKEDLGAQAFSIDSEETEAEDEAETPIGNFSWNNISVGISRFGKMHIGKPYVITYEIDPPIYPPGTFEARFDDQEQADVLCEVRQGEVQVQLQELDKYWQPTSHILAKSVIPAHPAEWHEPKNGDGNWVLRVTGIAVGGSYFKLYYQKKAVS